MSDHFQDLQNRFARNVTLATQPTDHALLRQAQGAKGHLGPKAVMDEYNRLVLQKHDRPARRGFWFRIFG